MGALFNLNDFLYLNTSISRFILHNLVKNLLKHGILFVIYYNYSNT